MRLTKRGEIVVGALVLITFLAIYGFVGYLETAP